MKRGVIVGSTKLDPKIKLIANEYGKVIKMTESTTEFHLKDDAAVVGLKEETGISAESSLKITIVSAGGSLELKGKTVSVISEEALSVSGQASGLMMDASTNHFKAPIVSQKK